MNPLTCYAGVAALAVVAASSAKAASVITFAGAGSTNTQIAPTFADFVPHAGGVTGVTVTDGQGTPNIDVSWLPQNAATNTVRWEYYTDAVWTGGVGQLNNASVGIAYTVQFTPNSGFGVQINSFNFFSYYASSIAPAVTNGEFSFDWAVVRVSDSSIQASGSTGLFTGGVASPIINVNFTAADTDAYNLVLTRTGGAASGANIAVDNISFGQVTPVAVPEPSAIALGGLAVGLMALRRRRA